MTQPDPARKPHSSHALRRIRWCMPLMAASLGTALQAETLSVCLDGTCDFVDIQTAIDAARDGDEIRISGETYLLEAALDTRGKSLRFVGETDTTDASPLTILDGRGRHPVVEHRNETERPRDLRFEGLRIQNGSDSLTGGLFLRGPGTMTITNCDFHKNNGVIGGAIHTSVNARSVIVDCTFEGNLADGGWGGAIKATADVEIRGCEFVGNRALMGVGGAIAVLGSTDARIETCLFSTNTAKHGGAIHSNSPVSLTVAGCHFEENSAIDPASDGLRIGGGIAHDSRERLELTGCTFRANDATLGGGVYASGDQLIADCTFTDNIASGLSGQGGGYHGINFSSAPLTIELRDCLFASNQSGRYGGAITLGRQGENEPDQIKATLTRCRFESNTAESASGALLLYGTETSLLECVFEGNESSGPGGAIASSYSTLSVDRCTVRHNTSAPGGGGLGIFGGSTSITASLITENEAGGQGGGLYISPDFGGLVELAQNVICSNVPDQISGAPFADDGSNCINEICVEEACTPDPCPADIDGDGEVGSKDLSELLSLWGCIVDPPGFACAEADLDGDGTVDGADLTWLISSWGACQ